MLPGSPLVYALVANGGNFNCWWTIPLMPYGKGATWWLNSFTFVHKTKLWQKHWFLTVQCLLGKKKMQNGLETQSSTKQGRTKRFQLTYILRRRKIQRQALEWVTWRELLARGAAVRGRVHGDAWRSFGGDLCHLSGWRREEGRSPWRRFYNVTQMQMWSPTAETKCHHHDTF